MAEEMEEELRGPERGQRGEGRVKAGPRGAGRIPKEKTDIREERLSVAGRGPLLCTLQ